MYKQIIAVILTPIELLDETNAKVNTIVHLFKLDKPQEIVPEQLKDIPALTMIVSDSERGTLLLISDLFECMTDAIKEYITSLVETIPTHNTEDIKPRSFAEIHAHLLQEWDFNKVVEETAKNLKISKKVLDSTKEQFPEIIAAVERVAPDDIIDYEEELDIDTSPDTEEYFPYNKKTLH